MEVPRASGSEFLSMKCLNTMIFSQDSKSSFDKLPFRFGGL